MAKKPEAVVQTPYLWLLESRAPTLSGSSAITYAVLADPDHSHVHLLITSAEGGGNFNRELVCIDALEAAIDAAPASKPFGSKLLKSAYRGKSNNNAPYACAALIAQGLLAKSAEMKFGLVKSGDWEAWKLQMMSQVGEPYLFPPQPASPPASATVSDSEAGNARKKDRRGGKRHIPVVPEQESDEEELHVDPE